MKKRAVFNLSIIFWKIIILIIIINNNLFSQDLIKSQDLIDFGDCPIGVTSNHAVYMKSFYLKNISIENVTLINVVTYDDYRSCINEDSCNWFSTWESLAKSVGQGFLLKPGDSLFFTIWFQSAYLDSISSLNKFLTGKSIITYYKADDNTKNYYVSVNLKARAKESKSLFSVGEEYADWKWCPDLITHPFTMDYIIRLYNTNIVDYYVDSVKSNIAGKNLETIGFVKNYPSNNYKIIDFPVKLNSNSFLYFAVKYTSKEYGLDRIYADFYCRNSINNNITILHDSIVIKTRDLPTLQVHYGNNYLVTDSIGATVLSDYININTCTLSGTFSLDSVTFSNEWTKDELTYISEIGSLPIKLNNDSITYAGKVRYISNGLGKKEGTAYFHFTDLSVNQPINILYYQTTLCSYDPYGGIQEDKTNKLINIYPNPSVDNIDIYFDNKIININKISIINIIGMEIFLKDMADYNSNVLNISLSNLPSGTYFIKFLMNNSIIVKNIIKY